MARHQKWQALTSEVAAERFSDLPAFGKNNGAQDYALPAGFDPAGYNEIYVWCTEYAVSLGVAAVK